MKQLLLRVLENKFALMVSVFAAAATFYFLPTSTVQAAVPFGHVDSVSQAGYVNGWAIDPDIAGAHIEIHAYFDGPAGKSKTLVGTSTKYDRCDVHFYTDFNDCGFDYGFEFQVPANLQDGREHKLYVYALDARVASAANESGWPKTGASTLLTGSPKSFRIGMSANTPRHARGALIEHNGTIYFVGEQFRYPFPSAEVFLSWGVNFSQVVPANSGDLALPIGYIVSHKTQSSSQPDQSNRLPKGNIDGITTHGRLRGWIFDPDASSSQVEYKIAFDGQYGNTSFPIHSGLADYFRSDVNSAFGISGNHGFEIDVYSIPGLTQNTTHEAWIYAIDKNDGSMFIVNGSPYSFFMLTMPAPSDSVLSRDNQRLAKVREIQTALELYYNDNGEYPEGVNLDLANYGLGINGWTTNPVGGYLNIVGTPPAPDGTCLQYINKYNYVFFEDSPNHYNLVFCLGGSAQGFGPGIHFASPSGID